MTTLKLLQTGKAGSDCTAPYDVKIYGQCTVKEFVECVFAQFPKEWGYIGIADGSIFGNPKVEYSKGRLTTENNLKNVENCTVLKATTRGGWSRMDYYLQIETRDGDSE